MTVPEKVRFSGENVLDVMTDLVEKHVLFYKSDYYEHDIHTIQNTVGKSRIADRRFLWLLRRYGTRLFREIDVITRIPERKSFEYYHEYCHDILLFGIETRIGNKDVSHIFGDIFFLDYSEEYLKMKELSFASDGKDVDKSFYAAVQWHRHQMMLG